MTYRPNMSTSTKLAACLHLMGLADETIQWDHDPPLCDRPFDEATKTYTPDANDPRYIVPRPVGEHKKLTAADAKKRASDRRTQRMLGSKADRLKAAQDALQRATDKPSRDKPKRFAMPGSRDSKYKRKMDGTVVLR
jgi:hypothetical protein